MRFLYAALFICSIVVCFYAGPILLVIGLIIWLIKLIRCCFPKKKPIPVKKKVPENIRLTDDRNDPDGWEEVKTGSIMKASLLKVLENEGFCKERIDRFAKMYPDNRLFSYTIIYV